MFTVMLLHSEMSCTMSLAGRGCTTLTCYLTLQLIFQKGAGVLIYLDFSKTSDAVLCGEILFKVKQSLE